MRRSLIVVIASVPILALFNVFGQRPSTATASSSSARLSVYAPTRLRGGLLYMARFRIEAYRDLKDMILVLDPGWVESITVNSIVPSPESQTSRDGKLALRFGRLRAGSSYVLYLDFQVNPTNVGRRPQSVSLYDGTKFLLAIHRTVTVFP